MLAILVGEETKGLSPNVVSRLKVPWAEEHAWWNKCNLSTCHYVYWWMDGIHTGLCAKKSTDGQCLWVIIGVTPEGMQGARRDR